MNTAQNTSTSFLQGGCVKGRLYINIGAIYTAAYTDPVDTTNIDDTKQSNYNSLMALVIEDSKVFNSTDAILPLLQVSYEGVDGSQSGNTQGNALFSFSVGETAIPQMQITSSLRIVTTGYPQGNYTDGSSTYTAPFTYSYFVPS
jgi:hypothetical protein